MRTKELIHSEKEKGDGSIFQPNLSGKIEPSPFSSKAQSIIEYVAIIMVIIAVFIAMGAYYKRSLQARYRQAGDVLGGGEQYTPVVKAP